MVYLIYLFIIAGFLLILLGVIGSRGYRPIDTRLHEVTPRSKRDKIRAIFAPLILFVQRILAKLKLEGKLKRTLDASHLKLAPAEFFSIKIGFILILCILSIFVLGRLNPIALVICFLLGYVVPDLWLYRKIARRKQAIARLLPETVDLLALCIDAGLDFITAVKWIIEKTRSNPMVEELVFILEEIKWGKPRSQALKDMAKRLVIPEVSSFTQTLILAERMGTPVGEAFTILSEDMRLQRFHRGERIAMQAPLKILMPLIFCILPVIGIIIGGPIFLQFMQGSLFRGFGR